MVNQILLTRCSVRNKRWIDEAFFFLPFFSLVVIDGVPLYIRVSELVIDAASIGLYNIMRRLTIYLEPGSGGAALCIGLAK